GYRVEVARLAVAARVRNRSREPVTFTVAWRLDADYADIQEAQADRQRDRPGIRHDVRRATLEWTYIGDPRLSYRTVIHATQARPWRVEADSLTDTVTLQPGETLEIPLSIEAIDGTPVDDAATRDRESQL